ncbi:MAG: aminomethyl transferase family protein [Deltaproteobacteria bacterium]|nr:aminomethyl transferase family protein [Deltaproteobacteria bacterium]MBI3391231.1 aminomethyl transferase family protein [Deltaproteobacteria bacterium]
MSWADLDRAQAAAGATCDDTFGVRVPRAFGSPQREWQAVRRAVGILDARHRGLIAVTGEDRITFLQGQLTNDVKQLAPGSGTHAALLTIQGRVVADLYVFVLADRVLLDVPAIRVDAVRKALERFIIADDVELAIGDDMDALLSIEGPRAAPLLSDVTGATLADLQPYQHREITIDSVTVRVVAIGQTGETGFRLLSARANAATVWQRLTAAGATPVGLDALNVLRLEAGIPWYGLDMDEETLVMEVGLDDAISFSKGCYLGQEVVERVAARGHVNRKLSGLVGEASIVPPAGTTLTRDGKDVGHVTSAAASPALSSIIALGYVHRSAGDIGTVLQAGVNDQPIDLTITARPFYRS